MNPIIEATGVIRTYGTGAAKFPAVAGVDLTVQRGELVAILGANGAGKTSLVEVLEGMAPASGGTVRVFGTDPHAGRVTVRPRTGIMLQEAGFAGDLTVADTLTMWAGTLAAPRPIAEALEIVDLTHRARVPVKSLSGGERRRLDLGLATLGRPELLFLDEPTTGLDPSSRERTWELVGGMLAAGTTVLLTTHYLEEAEALADRVIMMAAGRIIREGTVTEIVADQPSLIRMDPQVLVDLPLDLLATLPALVAAPQRDRLTVVLATRDLQATLGSLLDLAASRSVTLAGLDARTASLEQAFLAMTGAPTLVGRPA